MKKISVFCKSINLILFFLFVVIIGYSQTEDCTHSNFDHENGTINCKGNIIVNGKVDGGSVVYLVSTGGSCAISDKVDGSSTLTISCLGSVSIGNKIDGSSRVSIRCSGDITIGDKIDGSSQCDFYSEHGHILIKDKTDNSGTLVRWHSQFPIIVINGTNRANVVQY